MEPIFYRPDAGHSYTLSDARTISPSIRVNSTDADLAEFGFVRLYPAAPEDDPTPGAYQVRVELSPIMRDGRYHRRFTLAEMFPHELNIRGEVVSIEAQRARYDAGRLSEAKTAARTRLAASYARAVAAGWVWSEADDVIALDTDRWSLMSDVADLARARSAVGGSVSFLSKSGKIVSLQGGAFLAMYRQAQAYRVALWSQFGSISAAIEAADSLAALADVQLVIGHGI